MSRKYNYSWRRDFDEDVVETYLHANGVNTEIMIQCNDRKWDVCLYPGGRLEPEDVSREVAGKMAIEHFEANPVVYPIIVHTDYYELYGIYYDWSYFVESFKISNGFTPKEFRHTTCGDKIRFLDEYVERSHVEHYAFRVPLGVRFLGDSFNGKYLGSFVSGKIASAIAEQYGLDNDEDDHQLTIPSIIALRKALDKEKLDFHRAER